MIGLISTGGLGLLYLFFASLANESKNYEKLKLLILKHKEIFLKNNLDISFLELRDYAYIVDGGLENFIINYIDSENDQEEMLSLISRLKPALEYGMFLDKELEELDGESDEGPLTIFDYLSFYSPILVLFMFIIVFITNIDRIANFIISIVLKFYN